VLRAPIRTDALVLRVVMTAYAFSRVWELSWVSQRLAAEITAVSDGV
jgi:hypothetical protein